MENQNTEYSILIIDDSQMYLLVLKKILLAQGYSVLTAKSGPEGRKKAIENKPDLILLDVIMEGESGFDVVEELKKTKETASIPVIFLTGIKEIDSKVKGFALGAVDYIVKPFHEEEVLARVGIHIKLSIATNEMIASQAAKLRQLKEAQTSILVAPESLPEAKSDVFYSALEEAGGDLYDIFRISEKIFGYFVGDVSGHDIKTSFITSSLKVLLKQNCTPVNTAAESLTIINNVLEEVLPKGKFLTACYVHVNKVTMKATVISAGHPVVLFAPAEGDPVILDNRGDLLGMFKNVAFDPHIQQVSEGDRFYLFTDGLIEQGDFSFSPEELNEKLKSIALALKKDPLHTLAKSFKEEFSGSQAEQKDDILVLVFEV
ncbi:MAG: SpoIIE family protein phosphatase [Nitrospinota bacterium]